MDFQSLATLAIVGAAISGFVQFVKATTLISPAVTRLLVIGLSLLTAGAYWFVKDSSILPVFIQVVGLANTVYLFLIKPLENANLISE